MSANSWLNVEVPSLIRARSRLLPLLLSLACVCAGPSLRADDAPGVDLRLSATVAQYALQEIRFKVPGKVDNPFSSAEITVDGRFTAPSGQVLRVPAFYWQSWDPILNAPGRDESWVLRFTPTEAGPYAVRVVVSRAGLTGKDIAKAAFECTPAQGTGFVRTNGRRFALTTGESFLPVGANRCWGDLREPKRYLDDLDKLSAAGANCVRVWLAPWWLPIEGKAGACDPRASALLDLIVRRAESDHLKIVLCIQQHGNFEPEGREVARWSTNPYNAAKGGPCKTVAEFFTNPAARRIFKDHLRYFVARWGYSTSLMAWELFNEVEFVPFEQGDFAKHEPDVRSWHREMAVFLRTNDPFGHLVATSSDVALQRKLVLLHATDFVQLHIYEKGSLAKRVQEAVGPLAKELTVPVVVGEFGGPETQDGRFVTRGVLSAVLSGAAGALPWLQDTADPAPGYRRLGIARRFLEAAPLAGDPMAPIAPEIVQERPDDARTAGRVQFPSLHAIALGRENLVLAYCYEWPAGPAPARDRPAPPPAGLRIPGVKEGGFSAETWDCATGTIVQRQTLKAGAPESASGRNPAPLLVEALWSGEDIALRIVRQAAKPQP